MRQNSSEATNVAFASSRIPVQESVQPMLAHDQRINRLGMSGLWVTWMV